MLALFPGRRNYYVRQDLNGFTDYYASREDYGNATWLPILYSFYTSYAAQLERGSSILDQNRAIIRMTSASSSNTTTKVVIVSPTDLVGMIPGGIDTCIKGLIKWAPDDIEYSLVGVTSRPDLAPISKITRLNLGSRSVDFMPIMKLWNPHAQNRIPLIFRFCMSLLACRQLPKNAIYQAHRMEPFLIGLRPDHAPRVMFQHTHMDAIRNPDTDIRWRAMPSAYFALERRAIASVKQVFAVHQGEAERLRCVNQSPGFKSDFLPSWVDPDIFHPADRQSPSALEERQQLDLSVREAPYLVFCGRLEKGKRPFNMLEIFSSTRESFPGIKLVLIGDGSLRESISAAIGNMGLANDVVMLGVLEQREVGAYLRHAEALVLPSAYEGMPRAILEALGSGIPVVSTDVGEVSSVLRSGVNGHIVPCGDDAAFADALNKVLHDGVKLDQGACASSVLQYRPSIVLQPVYDAYRRLDRERESESFKKGLQGAR